MNIGVEIPAVDQLHLRRAFFGQMNVGIGKPRDACSPLEIDGLSVRASQAADVLGFAGCNDAPAGARQCLMDRTVRGEAADFAIKQYQIRIGEGPRFHEKVSSLLISDSLAISRFVTRSQQSANF